MSRRATSTAAPVHSQTTQARVRKRRGVARMPPDPNRCLRVSSISGTPVDTPRGMDRRVRTAIDVMLRDLDQPLRVTGLARRVNLSRSRFTHLFREETG